MDLIEFHRFVTPLFSMQQKNSGRFKGSSFFSLFWATNRYSPTWSKVSFVRFPLTMHTKSQYVNGTSPFFIGDTSSNGCFSIVILVFAFGVYHSAHVNVLCPESDGTFCRKRRRWVAEKRPLRLLCAPWRWQAATAVKAAREWKVLWGWKFESRETYGFFWGNMPHYHWKLRIVISQYLTQNQAVKLQFWYFCFGGTYIIRNSRLL